jgi:hypothetical protein
MMLGLAIYAGVLTGLLACAWYILNGSRIPKVPRSWAGTQISGGDCPEDGCGGRTYMLATESFSTLWRCVSCRSTWLLAALPRE